MVALNARTKCPTCQREFTGALTHCPIDKTALVVSQIAGEETEAGDTIFNAKFKKMADAKTSAKSTSAAPEGNQCPMCDGVFPTTTALCSRCDVPLTPITKDPLLGQVLGGYEILDVLGQGGMAVVYKGRHTLMDRVVAVKMLRGQMQSDPEKTKRFRQEARAASCLSHPNLVTLYDFGLAPDGRAYLVMDYLEGRSLQEVLEAEKHLPVARVVRIFRQVCDALAHAHEKGVVHRDIKPSNILLLKTLDGTDQVKVVDFGIAKMLDSGPLNKAELHQTLNGQIFGSPLYMSPEQCMSKPITVKTDVYCVGTTMYECLTGAPPAAGSTIAEVITKQITRRPPKLAEARPDLRFPEQLEELLAKCLEKEPDSRHHTMQDLKEHLDSVPSVQDAARRTVISAKDVAAHAVSPAVTDDKRVSGLFSVIEFDILKLLVEGWSDEEISARLQITPEALFTHRLNIIKTLTELS